MREAPSLSANVPEATPHSNKLRVLSAPEVQDYAVLLYVDCDVLFVADPLPFLKRDKLQVRTGRAMWATVAMQQEIWGSIFRFAGVTELPQSEFGWPNTGVIAFPTAGVATFLESWYRFTVSISQWLRDAGEMIFLRFLPSLFPPSLPSLSPSLFPSLSPSLQ